MIKTKSAEHTPGPWAIESDEWGINVYRKDHGIGRLYICESLQSEGDARLIKAAPDMFDALKEIIDDLRQCNGGKGPQLPISVKILEQAKAALP